MTEPAAPRPVLARLRVPASQDRDGPGAMGASDGVRVGDMAWVGATFGTDERGELRSNDIEEQTDLALRNLGRTLRRLGAQMDDVVLTRVYTVDISRRELIARAHRKHFEGIAPATSVVEVLQLHHPFALVAVEAVASVRAPPPA